MRLRGLAAAVCMVTIFTSQGAAAETFSFASYGSFSSAGDISRTMLDTGTHERIHLNTAMMQKPRKVRRRSIPVRLNAPSATNLKTLIGWAESRTRGYDAIQHGAKKRPAKVPTHMTISEIYRWIARTPGQPHAIGRYQFIPSTLKSLVSEAGLGQDTVFTSRVQDMLADFLLEDAGYSSFVAGEISRHRFMENLARIWAGFPTATGQSYYHGYAGNRAVITWNEFDAHMKKIFPS
ncbi:hypothetical protein SAMN04488523_11375 [Sulfitobacter brevis]|uniref:Gluconate 2-dehydrogenase subunit 3 n=1 Tax=Sulfitobacter brevis TaxID=74348 RepID=A0A1I2EUR0_9RHOB|nr:hypothetical protein [Sulfitobacter brevis]SFE96585.1 hypothetical protein SAMN04488523_11375 [Sulfitobacter brevis]